MERITGRGKARGDKTLMFSEQQATGLERFELLGKLEGVDVFDMKPLEMTRIGTPQDPIPIYSLVSLEEFEARRSRVGARTNSSLDSYLRVQCDSLMAPISVLAH